MGELGEELLGSGSLLWIYLQTGFHEGLQIRFGRKGVLGQLSSQFHQVNVLHRKWSPFVNEFISQNSDAPNVQFLVLRVFEGDFRREVVPGPTHGNPLFFVPEKSSEAEIREIHFLPFDEKVFGLDVSVEGFLGMNVLKGGEKLLENEDDFGVIEGLLLHPLEESALSDVLEDEMHCVVFNETAIELDDVSMVEGGVDADFPSQIPFLSKGDLPKLDLFSSQF